MDKLVSVIDDEVVKLHGMYRRGEPGGVRLVTVAGPVDIRCSLAGADMRGANLSRADLSGADLSGANLSWANLSRADLSGADMRRADLRRADLSGANLRGADLSGADMRGAKNTETAEALTAILPAGALTVFKKARTARGKVLVTLEIPPAAKRSNATGRKCRAEYAIVRGVEGIGWEYDGSPVVSEYDGNFKYPAIGETVFPTQPFDTDRWNECASGIHFFITRYEAENY